VEARRLGRGGITALAEATGVHPDTIARGVRESEGVAEPARRVRAPGGGRKKLSDTDPELMAALTALVDPDTRGDPMSPLVWTTKSTRNLADQLDKSAVEHTAGPRAVAHRHAGISPLLVPLAEDRQCVSPWAGIRDRRLTECHGDLLEDVARIGRGGCLAVHTPVLLVGQKSFVSEESALTLATVRR
jgi:Rhodopirellula transposase DDE domain